MESFGTLTNEGYNYFSDIWISQAKQCYVVLRKDHKDGIEVGYIEKS